MNGSGGKSARMNVRRRHASRPRAGPVRGPRRGASLIEALVAMAVTAFGMLGVLGLQSTLRANADLAKQRSEATRLAQERIEDWRAFSVLPATAGSRSYAAIPIGTTRETIDSTTGFGTNTSFTRSSEVTEAGPPPDLLKTVRVTVSWRDRADVAQSVRLFSVVAGQSPELAASMVAPPQGAGGMAAPENRRRGIPPAARNFGDGTSGFRPPQNAANLAWVFNNTTGVVTSVCTTSAGSNATLTLASLTSCSSAQAYQLISGHLRFDHTTPPTAASVFNPAGAVPGTLEAEVEQTQPAAFAGVQACHHEYAANHAAFHCLMRVETPSGAMPSPPWSGTLRVRPATVALSPTLADATTANRKVCRYRALADPVPNPVYQNINAPLANENLVVIAAGNGSVANACPNPPTRAHQPAV
jgi:Tfp pilus assembly protein PilV